MTYFDSTGFIGSSAYVMNDSHGAYEIRGLNLNELRLILLAVSTYAKLDHNEVMNLPWDDRLPYRVGPPLLEALEKIYTGSDYDYIGMGSGRKPKEA